MKTPLAIVGLAIVVLGFVAFSALFTVDQRTQVIVLKFGNPVRVIKDPGLHAKIPFIENVVAFDRRILNLDPPSEQVLLSDQKRIDVDAYARYRIVDPLRFYQTLNNENNLRDRFGRQLNSSVRNALGLHDLADLLSPKRAGIMAGIHDQVKPIAASFGIEVIDVRIGRTELPDEVSANVYARMRSEREQLANLLRAEGDELKQRITADADRQRVVILAESQKQAQIEIGQGEAERNRITAEAYGRDPQFFAFVRSMTAYRRSLGGSDTTMVLSPDSDFFRFFGNLQGLTSPRE